MRRIRIQAEGLKICDELTVRAGSVVLMVCLTRDGVDRTQIVQIQEVSNRFKPRLTVCLLWGTTHPLAQLLKIYGTPTFILFKDGVEIGRLLGRKNKADLTTFISAADPFED